MLVLQLGHVGVLIENPRRNGARGVASCGSPGHAAIPSAPCYAPDPNNYVGPGSDFPDRPPTMIATDDKRPGYPSVLADLRQVPLADVSALSEDMLRRLVPAPLAGQVPVATFNSAV